MRKLTYNIINNSLGWLCFIVAAVSYLLTIEPTASFWDCPEFIAQGFKLEVGHPPGNPIFMLTARFFINFFGSEPGTAAMAVNSMNALLSAGTILLLFWTITHLMRRLLTGFKPLEEISASQKVVIFASGIVGALTYAWSDTFWYSAVEGEVYAFSSFCTALVFWLILKWENRADQPHSDRYLILIAYVIGVSIAVHLLNLLCIPAIVLVFYYRKWTNVSAKGSIIALLISFVIVALILYGLVPGFVEVAQYSELFFVNVIGMGYNSGVIIYTLLTLAIFIWTISELYRQRSPRAIKVSFALAVLFSGIPFIGSSLIIPVLIMAALAIWLVKAKLHIRILNIVTLSIFVIFIGYSSYALILIRSAAETPINQNAPDNVFALGSYLNREQYGSAPLFYGTTFVSQPYYTVGDDGNYKAIASEDFTYAKAADGHGYVKMLNGRNYKYSNQMLFPRIYDSRFSSRYMAWGGFNQSEMATGSYNPFEYAEEYAPENQKALARQYQSAYGSQAVRVPTFEQNLSYFVNYQLVHMYFRYFMWNFAGRQNDIQNLNGEVNHGNWISGIPFIDNARLGDQSTLPTDFGAGNKGHNVFYLLPLLLGLAGLIWQSMKGEEGIRQFWVVFFLFFMTGLAIVLYLNQTPDQPRERDYAYAGSFYAFAIWIGLGVGAVAAGLQKLLKKEMPAAIIAGVLCLIVPLQMVSQTWDDHDRSGRFTARDFGMNYLASLEPNAIVFTNGDNDTFPLWYAQEVEGFRTDVRVVNLSYLTTDWYAFQQMLPAYEAPAIDMQATKADLGNSRLQVGFMNYDALADTMTVSDFLREYYASKKPGDLTSPAQSPTVSKLVIPGTNGNSPIYIDLAKALERKGQKAGDESFQMTQGDALVLDIIATSAANGWDRPIYFANTVPSSYYVGLDQHLYNTGMAQHLRPDLGGDYRPVEKAEALKAYDNIMNKFRWGGLDTAKGGDVYLDETVKRMVLSSRYAIMTSVGNLYNAGEYKKAYDLLQLIDSKISTRNAPLGVSFGSQIAEYYLDLAEHLDEKDAAEARSHAIDIYKLEIETYAPYLKWIGSLTDSKLDPTDYSAFSGWLASILRYRVPSYDSFAPDVLKSMASFSPGNVSRVVSLDQTDLAPLALMQYDSAYGLALPYSYFMELIEGLVNAAGPDAAEDLLRQLSATSNFNLVAFVNAFRQFEDDYIARVITLVQRSNDQAFDYVSSEGSDSIDLSSY